MSTGFSSTLKSRAKILFVLLPLLVGISCKQSSGFSGSSGKKPAVQQKPSSNSTPAQTPVPQVSPVPISTPPVIPNAIVKGSFTVWADPPNPVEGQDYNIHIRIQLPPATSSYGRLDLSGVLTGTDGYSQTINGLDFFKQTFNFVPGSGYAEFIMPIPGAERGVNDTIKVTSKLVSESQVIIVHFN